MYLAYRLPVEGSPDPAEQGSAVGGQVLSAQQADADAVAVATGEAMIVHSAARLHPTSMPLAPGSTPIKRLRLVRLSWSPR